VERSTSPQRVAVTLLGVLSGLALLLATIGLYAATYVGSSTYVDVLPSIHHLSLTTAPIRLTIDNNFRLPTPVEAAT
jgi:disulfide bond formation protein DsbB